MQNIAAAWLYAAILVARAQQASGPPTNGALRNAVRGIALVARF